MKCFHVAVAGSLLLSACQAVKDFGPADARAAKPVATAKKAASPTPSPSAAAQKNQRGEALVRAIHNALGATRVSRASLTLNSASGVLANNGGNLISDNGLGIVSNNGSGVISNNGSSYHVAATPQDYDVEAAGLLYRWHYVTQRAGELKIYEAATYRALPEARREEALIDHFKWDDINLAVEDLGPPLVGFIEFPLQIVSSKRVAFVKHMTTRQKVRVKDMKTGARSTLGWEYLIDIDASLPDGSVSTSKFKAVSGPEDIQKLDTTSGKTQSLPLRSTVTGTNEHGAYTGDIDYDAGRVTLHHTATEGGIKTDVVYVGPAVGANTLTVTCEEADMRVEVTMEKDATTGTGRMVDLESQQAIGSLTYDATGLATFTFTDGTSVKARLL